MSATPPRPPNTGTSQAPTSAATAGAVGVDSALTATMPGSEATTSPSSAAGMRTPDATG
jgi:hypothetical protein